ncbi:nitroreductase family protein [Vagococcus silagei]|uniref:Nitroreductase family protein n=1 Tax=Vagococcus silagei TaxID=2508885 RepID=A0A4S3B2M4_9ENTE|nr:nitroreductase family protein [Vagococcus silagei]THB61062.1 nitroreductase family protein [Vagococcus silagei]
MSEFLSVLKNRRSIYALSREVNISEEQIENLIKEVVKHSPTAFNSQTQRIVILFDNANEKLWELTEEALKPLTPAEAFPNTQAKLNSFANAKGTVLFFEDTDVVRSLQEQFALYAENFPIWSEQASGLTQSNVWMALAEAGLGANLQHYNPVIDEKVQKEWDIPAHWQLRAQLVFGAVEAPANEKEFIDAEDRFKVYR